MFRAYVKDNGVIVVSYRPSRRFRRTRRSATAVYTPVQRGQRATVDVLPHLLTVEERREKLEIYKNWVEQEGADE